MGSGPSLALTVCPLTGVPFEDPVKASDGHTYSRRAIELWIQSRKDENGTVLSPLTREPLDEKKKLVKDEAASDAVQTAFSPHLFRGKAPQASIARTLEGEITSVYDLNRAFAVCDSLGDVLARVLDTWQPPKLVVIGEESSGKSTLLERLLMMSVFPRAEGVCTRARIHVRLRHRSTSGVPRLSVIDASSEETVGGPWMIAAETGHLTIKEEMQRLVEESGPKSRVCTSRILLLQIEGPHLPSIDLIDLPGLVQAPKEAEEATRALVEAQISESSDHALFMAVVTAGRKPTSSAALRIIEDHGLGSKTLGVFTHFDELHVNKKNQLRRWLTEPDCGHDDCHYPLQPYGWVATSNAPLPQAKLAEAAKLLTARREESHGSLLRLQQQAKNEMAFFRNEGMHDLIDMGLVGTCGLQIQLQAMFTKYLLHRWAPLTIFRLNRECERLRYAAALLGSPSANGILRSEQIAGVRLKARAAAAKVVRAAVPRISHALAQQVLLPLQEKVSSLLGVDITCPPDELDALLHRLQDQLYEACKEAAQKAPSCFLSCARSALEQDEVFPRWPSADAKALMQSPPFVISRFPNFISAIVNHMSETLAPWKGQLRENLQKCIKQVFDVATPWVKTKTRLTAQRPMAHVTCATEDILSAIWRAFMQQSASSFCEQFIGALEKIADQVFEWNEPKAAQRRTIERNLSNIEEAKSKLLALLGVKDTPIEELVKLEKISLALTTCTGVGLSHAFKNRPAKFMVLLRDHDGNPCSLPPEYDFNAWVSSARDSNFKMRIKVIQTSEGVYTGEYRLTGEASDSKISQEFSLTVELYGNAIAGSPFQLSVSEEPQWTSVLTFGGIAPNNSDLGFPTGIAVDNDQIYVADMGLRRVQVFGSQSSLAPGEFLRTLWPEDTDPKALSPWGVAIDRSEVYVVDSSSSSVKVYSKDDGCFLHMFGSAGRGDGELDGPCGIAMDGDAVFVADTGNNRIQVFLRRGVGCFVPSRIIGSKGCEDGQLDRPLSLTVDGDDIYVVDKGNARVQVFNKKDGSWVRSFGEMDLKKPIGIAAGGPYIHVSDSTQHRICVFDKADGALIRTVGSRGSAEGCFINPGCIVVHGSDVYITEKGNQRVQVFR